MDIEHTNRKVRIFEKNSGREIDAIELVLLCFFRLTLLPEIYEIFGKDITLKLFGKFGGQTITFPPRSELMRIRRDADIFIRLQANDNPVIRKRIASEYDLSVARVTDIYYKVEKIVKEQETCQK